MCVRERERDPGVRGVCVCACERERHPRGEALLRCARPSGVPSGPATSTGSLASQCPFCATLAWVSWLSFIHVFDKEMGSLELVSFIDRGISL